MRTASTSASSAWSARDRGCLQRHGLAVALEVRTAHIERVGERGEGTYRHLTHGLGAPIQLVPHPGDQRAVVIVRGALVERPLHGPLQRFGLRWLLDVIRDAHAKRGLRGRFVATSGEEDHADVRILLLRGLREIEPRHATHGEVGDEDRGARLLQLDQGLLRRGELTNFVADAFQDAGIEGARGPVVVDHEDDALAAVRKLEAEITRLGEIVEGRCVGGLAHALCPGQCDTRRP